jgi:hypothetical protein
MPQTKKGKKIMSAMKKQYGEKKGKAVYFASIVKGKIKGAEGKGGTGKLAKAKRTYAKRTKKKKMQMGGVIPRTGSYTMHRGEMVLPSSGTFIPSAKGRKFNAGGFERARRSHFKLGKKR